MELFSPMFDLSSYSPSLGNYFEGNRWTNVCIPIEILYWKRPENIFLLLFYGCLSKSKCITHKTHYVAWQTAPRVAVIDHTAVGSPAELPEHVTVGFLWGKLPNLGCWVMNFPVLWHFFSENNKYHTNVVHKITNIMQMFPCVTLGMTRESLKQPNYFLTTQNWNNNNSLHLANDSLSQGFKQSKPLLLMWVYSNTST